MVPEQPVAATSDLQLLQDSNIMSWLLLPLLLLLLPDLAVLSCCW
jgi:hypothetical protein